VAASALAPDGGQQYRRAVNKHELVAALATTVALPRKKAAQVVDALFGADGVIATELRKNGKVQVSGFGVFELRRRAGRSMRNPRTGKTITLPATTMPAFKAGKPLKDAVARRRA
jgi:DNA-binding protein HU-beta